jgi:hypothetical protein
VSLPAATELRAAVIAALKADSGLQATAMGASPRVVNRAPEREAFPYLVVRGAKRPWDTTTDRGDEHELEIYLAGEAEGDKEGEVIFFAVAQALRDWAPQTFSAHRLVNLVLRSEDVRAGEGGRRYFGLQRWRAITEEI